MAEEKQQENTTASISRPNREFNVMKLRLYTEDFLGEIEKDLRGGYFQPLLADDGTAKNVFIETGNRLCNEIGVQAIMKILKLHINPHTVQGNFIVKNKVSEDFDLFMMKFQIMLGDAIVINRYSWEFEMDNHTWFTQSVRGSVERFLSRSLDNLERQSYSDTQRSVESNTLSAKGGGLSFFGKA